MPHPNEELIYRWFLSQARGDPEAVRALLADDVVWHVPGRNLVSKDYRGPDEVIGFLGRVRELTAATGRSCSACWHLESRSAARNGVVAYQVVLPSTSAH